MKAETFSKQRLARLHRVLSGYVERKEIPGLVALVSRRNDVHIETLGTLALGQPAPMQRDTIFRIASLAKPITAVAAMMLVEECKLRLDDSIEAWLPELAGRRVQFLQWAQIPLEGQFAALALFEIQRIVEGLIRVHDLLVA